MSTAQAGDDSGADMSEWEHLRAAFEADAGPLGFNLERKKPHPFVEPWNDYFDTDTGMRWGGFIAGHWAATRALEEMTWPAKSTSEPLRPDESREDQYAAGQWVRGWNACLDACKLAFETAQGKG